jgi:hypothetical protein
MVWILSWSASNKTTTGGAYASKRGLLAAVIVASLVEPPGDTWAVTVLWNMTSEPAGIVKGVVAVAFVFAVVVASIVPK